MYLLKKLFDGFFNEEACFGTEILKYMKRSMEICFSSSCLSLSFSVETNCDLWPSHLSCIDLFPDHSAWGQVLPNLWWWDKTFSVFFLSQWLFVCRFYSFGWIPKRLSTPIIKLKNNLVFISPFPFSCSERKEPKDMKAPERVDEHLEGRFSD